MFVAGFISDAVFHKQREQLLKPKVLHYFLHEEPKFIDDDEEEKTDSSEEENIDVTFIAQKFPNKKFNFILKIFFQDVTIIAPREKKSELVILSS